jgi:hypothetical protein
MKVTRQHFRAKRTRNVQNWDSVRHEELEIKIRRQIRQLKACPLNGTDYVTYVIKDRVREVGKADVEVPFYVGQTSDLGRRALEHFKAGGWPTTDEASVYWRMYQILAAYRMPVFDILERTPTLATSLLSESSWVQRFISEGYVIWNQWSEHRPGKFAGVVPSKRLWTFTLREALMDDLRLSIGCRACGHVLDLPLEAVAQVAPLSSRLCDIRNRFRCPNCGAARCLRLSAFSEKESGMPAPTNAESASLFSSERMDIIAAGR